LLQTVTAVFCVQVQIPFARHFDFADPLVDTVTFFRELEFRLSVIHLLHGQSTGDFCTCNVSAGGVEQLRAHRERLVHSRFRGSGIHRYTECVFDWVSIYFVRGWSGFATDRQDDKAEEQEEVAHGYPGLMCVSMLGFRNDDATVCDFTEYVLELNRCVLNVELVGQYLPNAAHNCF